MTYEVQPSSESFFTATSERRRTALDWAESFCSGPHQRTVTLWRALHPRAYSQLLRPLPRLPEVCDHRKVVRDLRGVRVDHRRAPRFRSAAAILSGFPEALRSAKRPQFQLYVIRTSRGCCQSCIAKITNMHCQSYVQASDIPMCERGPSGGTRARHRFPRGCSPGAWAPRAGL